MERRLRAVAQLRLVKEAVDWAQGACVGGGVGDVAETQQRSLPGWQVAPP